MDPFPLTALRPVFRAAAVAFVPALEPASPATWEAVERTVAGALGARPAGVTRQLGLFLRVLDGAARLRHGRSLAGLDLPTRVRLLERFERAPILSVRRGIWGLRTLVFMGYYTQEPVIAALGYRASPAGWSARR